MKAFRILFFFNVAVLLAAGFTTSDAAAQAPGRPEPRPVSQEEISSTVTRVGELLKENYVYPEVGEKMAAEIAKRLGDGEYSQISEDFPFASKLAQDLRAISRDKHLGIIVVPPRPDAPPATRSEPAGEQRPRSMRGPNADRMRQTNYGFRRAEILDGNVGYLRFDQFVATDEAKETAANALAFLSNVNALVIDLRHNRGGSPDMIRFITSYFYEQPTLLNVMVDRNGDVVEEYHTLESIPGRRFSAEVPVYVLTSNLTFSGAEEFAYNLKSLERATVIGETTGGGAHPVRVNPVNDRFAVAIPFMRAKNPITGTNWEGVGVKPDIETSADEALNRALQEARTAIRGKSTPVSVTAN